MKLYEIAEEYESLMCAVESGDIPEEAIADTLESITSLLEDKADNIACLIKNLTAEAEAIKAEKKNLEDRIKAKERRVESLKAYLSGVLIRSGYGERKLETARNRISFRKSKGVAIDNECDFMIWAQDNRNDLLTYKDPTINRTAIKKAIEDGEEVVGAHIEDRLNIQIK